ncbi:MAG TPA: hypothetical protein VEI57_09715 [Nitrospirota bacterium]|nr:hypothetical protein [Nitrospirota bacterium]
MAGKLPPLPQKREGCLLASGSGRNLLDIAKRSTELEEQENGMPFDVLIARRPREIEQGVVQEITHHGPCTKQDCTSERHTLRRGAEATR